MKTTGARSRRLLLEHHSPDKESQVFRNCESCQSESLEPALTLNGVRGRRGRQCRALRGSNPNTDPEKVNEN